VCWETDDEWTVRADLTVMYRFVFVFVFCNIFVTGFPVKFGLLSPEGGWQQRCRAYQGHWGNRTFLMVEETGMLGENHQYMIRAENPFYMVQHTSI
jgi:hypothetical protein